MRRVRLKSANTNLDGYIADAVLHIEGQPPDLLQGVVGDGQKFAGLIPDLRRNLTAIAGYLCVPPADLCPCAVATLQSRTRVRLKRHAELTGDRSCRRHLCYLM